VVVRLVKVDFYFFCQALEKSGSSKLEKAEILQMTVDHLKFLQTSEVDGSQKGSGFPDAQKIAVDYHRLGKQT